VDLPGSVPVEIVDVIEARGGTVEEIVVVVVHAAVDFRIASGGNRHLPCRKSLSR
jgi:hypothetical protein